MREKKNLSSSVKSRGKEGKKCGKEKKNETKKITLRREKKVLMVIVSRHWANGPVCIEKFHLYPSTSCNWFYICYFLTIVWRVSVNSCLYLCFWKSFEKFTVLFSRHFLFYLKKCPFRKRRISISWDRLFASYLVKLY